MIAASHDAHGASGVQEIQTWTKLKESDKATHRMFPNKKRIGVAFNSSAENRDAEVERRADDLERMVHEGRGRLPSQDRPVLSDSKAMAHEKDKTVSKRSTSLGLLVVVGLSLFVLVSSNEMEKSNHPTVELNNSTNLFNRSIVFAQNSTTTDEFWQDHKYFDTKLVVTCMDSTEASVKEIDLNCTSNGTVSVAKTQNNIIKSILSACEGSCPRNSTTIERNFSKSPKKSVEGAFDIQDDGVLKTNSSVSHHITSKGTQYELSWSQNTNDDTKRGQTGFNSSVKEVESDFATEEKGTTTIFQNGETNSISSMIEQTRPNDTDVSVDEICPDPTSTMSFFDDYNFHRHQCEHINIMEELDGRSRFAVGTSVNVHIVTRSITTLSVFNGHDSIRCTKRICMCWMSSWFIDSIIVSPSLKEFEQFNFVSFCESSTLHRHLLLQKAFDDALKQGSVWPEESHEKMIDVDVHTREANPITNYHNDTTFSNSASNIITIDTLESSVMSWNQTHLNIVTKKDFNIQYWTHQSSEGDETSQGSNATISNSTHVNVDLVDLIGVSKEESTMINNRKNDTTLLPSTCESENDERATTSNTTSFIKSSNSTRTAIASSENDNTTHNGCMFNLTDSTVTQVDLGGTTIAGHGIPHYLKNSVSHSRPSSITASDTTIQDSDRYETEQWIDVTTSAEAAISEPDVENFTKETSSDTKHQNGIVLSNNTTSNNTTSDIAYHESKIHQMKQVRNTSCELDRSAIGVDSNGVTRTDPPNLMKITLNYRSSNNSIATDTVYQGNKGDEAEQDRDRDEPESNRPFVHEIGSDGTTIIDLDGHSQDTSMISTVPSGDSNTSPFLVDSSKPSSINISKLPSQSKDGIDASMSYGTNIFHSSSDNVSILKNDNLLSILETEKEYFIDVGANIEHELEYEKIDSDVEVSTDMSHSPSMASIADDVTRKYEYEHAITDSDVKVVPSFSMTPSLLIDAEDDTLEPEDKLFVNLKNVRSSSATLSSATISSSETNCSCWSTEWFLNYLNTPPSSYGYEQDECDSYCATLVTHQQLKIQRIYDFISFFSYFGDWYKMVCSLICMVVKWILQMMMVALNNDDDEDVTNDGPVTNDDLVANDDTSSVQSPLTNQDDHDDEDNGFGTLGAEGDEEEDEENGPGDEGRIGDESVSNNEHGASDEELNIDHPFNGKERNTQRNQSTRQQALCTRNNGNSAEETGSDIPQNGQERSTRSTRSRTRLASQIANDNTNAGTRNRANGANAAAVARAAAPGLETADVGDVGEGGVSDSVDFEDHVPSMAYLKGKLPMGNAANEISVREWVEELRRRSILTRTHDLRPQNEMYDDNVAWAISFLRDSIKPQYIDIFPGKTTSYQARLKFLEIFENVQRNGGYANIKELRSTTPMRKFLHKFEICFDCEAAKGDTGKMFGVVREKASGKERIVNIISSMLFDILNYANVHHIVRKSSRTRTALT